MTKLADVEADGFITCYPAHATTQPGLASTDLADARAVLADMIHHADAAVIAAARTVARNSAEHDERVAALQLLEILQRPAGSGGGQ